MREDRAASESALRGRLADVFFPALSEGAVEPLARRLGNRATVDDPALGRAAGLPAIEGLLARAAKALAERGARYEARTSTVGADADISEGVLTLSQRGESRRVPVAIVAARGRLREIELRAYHALERPVRAEGSRPPPDAATSVALPPVIAGAVGALAGGAIEAFVASFEESGRIVAPDGAEHRRLDGGLATFVAELAVAELSPRTVVDDGRTCGVEVGLGHAARSPSAALLCFERGDSGLVRELRLYLEP